MKVAEVLARLGQALGGEVDEARIIQSVIDGGRELSGAEVGEFLTPDAIESHATTIGIKYDSRLLVPVRSRSGDMLGALFFAHPDPQVFSPREEALLAAVASAAAIAIDCSRLFVDLAKQRAQAEEVSRHYRFLAESMPQLVWTSDADGHLDYVNERWLVYTGRSGASIIGDGWQSAVHPEDLPRVAEAWTAAMTGNATFDMTCRLRRGDGCYRWHLVRAYSLCSETRRIIKWFGTCTDIHDQKRFEDSQRLLSESSRVLASSFDLEVTLGTIASLVASWFRGYCLIDLFEHGRLTRLAAAHVDPDQRPVIDEFRRFSPGDNHESPLWRALTTGRTELCNAVTASELRQGASSERHRQLRESLGTSAYVIAPLLAGGEAVGTIMIGLIGDDRFGPDDVRPVEELGYRIALAVSNARAFAHAREANRLKDEFLAVVSHELRTPLNAMRGWMALLKSARLSADQQAHARDVIERNISAQTQLVEDLLDVSRIVSGRMRLSVQPVALQAVVGSAVESLKLAAEARGIDLETVVDLAAPPVNGDPDRLQQIVWNLLSNALKFTPRGGRVTVTLRFVDEHLELVVLDTGQGISPAFLPHVFERFRQGDSTTTRPIGGLGLGLAIVRNLVELHGGNISAFSEGEGQGARFTLTLPVAVAGAVPSALHGGPAGQSRDDGRQL